MPSSVNTNKNVNWISNSGLPFWIFYLILILVIRVGIPVFVPSGQEWTATHVIHGIISFIIMHWIKGSPDDDCNGECCELTFWEQIDQGTPWTPTKKVLMVVPTALFLMASLHTNYAGIHLAVNFPIWAILILGKLPEFHRVRVFGINATVGIDDTSTTTNTNSSSIKQQ